METDIEMLTSGAPTETIWPYFDKLPIMPAAEIADHFGQTRQNISQTLKRVFGKIYYEVKKDEPKMKPFELAIHMSKLFGVDYSSNTEVKKFFGLFPRDLRILIRTDGKGRLCGAKRRILSTLL